MFIRRIKGILCAFYRTFRATQTALKIFKTRKNICWDDPAVQDFSRKWGTEVLKDFNVELRVEGEATSEAAIYVGNHLSYLDIIALYSFKHLCFVAKSEVGTWPIIGAATKAVGSIFVERNSARSRVATAEALKKAVLDEGKSVCIFPEGTTSIQGKDWRRGVFRVAQENSLWIQPMGFIYTPIRRAAYIDDDTLLTHMWSLIQKDKTLLTIKFFEARKITDTENDMKQMEQEIRAWVDEQLKKQGYFESEIGYIE